MIGWNGKSVLKRLRRGRGLPQSLDVTGLSSRHMKPFPIDIQGYRVTYRKPKRFTWLMEPGSPIKQRHSSIAIHHKGDLVGFLDFVEFDLSPTTDNDELWEWLDGWSAYYGELATVLDEQWEDVESDVNGYGPILLFDNVWVRPDHARNCPWKMIARKAMDNLFDDRCIVIFKPFALEYEGSGDLAPVGYRRRMRALNRMAAREPGVYSMPNVEGLDQWYWSPKPKVSEVLLKNTRLERKKRARPGTPAEVTWGVYVDERPRNDNF